MARFQPIIARGLVAGFLGATALAVWFFAIDMILKRPLHTPAFIANILLGRETVTVSLPLVLGFTAVHYAFFLLLGVLISWGLDRIGAAPNVLLGFVVGFLLFDVIFYAGILLTSGNIVRALGWPNVLAGDLLAGLVLIGYLYAKTADRPFRWWAAFAEHRTLREGSIAGLLGAAVVALWFFVFDVLTHGAFFTPAALGSALFLQASGIAEVQLSIATVGGYTLVHLAAFVGIGLVAAAFVVQAEHQPPLLLGLVLFFATFEALFIGVIALFASWILGTLGWWTFAVANLLAAIVIGAYLWGEHPRLRREVHALRGRSLEEPV